MYPHCHCKLLYTCHLSFTRHLIKYSVLLFFVRRILSYPHAHVLCTRLTDCRLRGVQSLRTKSVNPLGESLGLLRCKGGSRHESHPLGESLGLPRCNEHLTCT